MASKLLNVSVTIVVHYWGGEGSRITSDHLFMHVLQNSIDSPRLSVVNSLGFSRY